MKLYLISIVVFFYGLPALAQTHKEVIHAGENLADHFTYRFPAYEEATVLLKKKLFVQILNNSCWYATLG